MKVTWWVLGFVALFVVTGVTVLSSQTRPLISSNQAMATAEKQLNVMGYMPPYRNLMMGTRLGWYNYGELFGVERVYFTILAFQPKSGAPMVNAEVVEDARSGNIISVFQYNTPPGNPLY